MKLHEGDELTSIGKIQTELADWKEKNGMRTSKHVGGFRNWMLSTKISAIISLVLIFIFGIMIAFTAVSVQQAVSNAVQGRFSAIAKANGQQVQQIIDAAITVNANINSYLQKAYRYNAEGKINMAGEEAILLEDETDTPQEPAQPDGAAGEEPIPTTPLDEATPANEANLTASKVNRRVYKSIILGEPLSELNLDIELYMTEQATSNASSNPDIYGVGVAFEPYRYDSNIESYSFYINEDNVNNDVIETYGDYTEYSQEPFYKQTLAAQASVLTDPVAFGSRRLVSVSQPIMSDNALQGVIFTDIDVSHFSKIESSNAQYPSMYASIYSDRGILVYDSDDANDIGKSIDNFFSNKEELQSVQASMQKGEAFHMVTTRENGQKMARFYYPISAGNATWWAMTALTEEDLNRASVTTSIWMVVISVAAMVILIFVLVLVLKKMLRPIGNVVRAAEQISQGNLDINLHSDSNDEIGQLSKAFSQTAEGLKSIIEDENRLLSEMAKGNFEIHSTAHENYIGAFAPLLTSMRNITRSLSSTLYRIDQASDQVASGSEQVSGGAQALSQGATEQASAVQELAATINEISGQIQANTQSAASANEKAVSVENEAMESNRRMQEMLSAMTDISTSSNEIGKIIKTIEDIAFQTNILALNAAVEAARAGAAGKGFAVVADEVRNLASKSAEASKNTSALIESSLKSVENGSRIADDTAKSLESVVEGIKDVASTVGRISEASKVQANSVAQVTMGIDQISSVVQTNSATAEESAAASEELSSQAQTLKGLVQQFQLRHDSIEGSGQSYSQPAIPSAPTQPALPAYQDSDMY